MGSYKFQAQWGQKKNRRKNAKNITYIYKRVFLSYYLFIAVGALS